MTTSPEFVSIDAQHFRRVLGHFPTGVAGITSIGTDGAPVGMAVGSFTSVSLDPPLVAFLPDKKSTTFPKIRDAGFFCANVLGANQEQICRAFASKAPDKFTDISWRPAGSRAPILDGAVAWIDCDIEAIHDAGDHYIVVGRVRELEVAEAGLPLLFFQGGYGRFAPLSFAAVPEPDLVELLRLVDIARPEMEQLASGLGVECLATALIGDEMVILASTGTPNGHHSPTRVGQHMPFIPPLGAIFVAWNESLMSTWVGRPQHESSPEMDRYRELVDRVRERGWSMGLGSTTHRELEVALSRMTLTAPTPAEMQRVQHAIDKLSGEYEPENLRDGQAYPVRNVSVPVFGPSGGVVLLLSVYGLPESSTVADVELYTAWLRRASQRVSRIIAT